MNVLHELSKGQMRQKEAARQLKLSERQVRALPGKLQEKGDAAVVHGLRGRSPNRRISAEMEKRDGEQKDRMLCIKDNVL